MVLPNLITVLAICAGLSGIRLAFEHRFETAVVMVLIAAFLDGIDGRVARLLKATSKFGAQMDSLADIVNFGVAPALVLYAFLLDRAGSPGWIAALLFAIACGLRLARFNVLDEDLERPAWQAEYFVGVPAPAGAVLVLLPVYLGFIGRRAANGRWSIASVVFTVLVAFLLVSRLPVYSGKTHPPARRDDWVMPLILGARVLRAAAVHLSLADAVGVGARLSDLPAAQRARLCAPRAIEEAKAARSARLPSDAPADDERRCRRQAEASTPPASSPSRLHGHAARRRLVGLAGAEQRHLRDLDDVARHHQFGDAGLLAVLAQRVRLGLVGGGDQHDALAARACPAPTTTAWCSSGHSDCTSISTAPSDTISPAILAKRLARPRIGDEALAVDRHDVAAVVPAVVRAAAARRAGRRSCSPA